jgi:hypothetical protein
VKGSILAESMDPVLALVVNLTLEDKHRPLYPSPLVEPSFYRMYLKPWIYDGLQALNSYREKQMKLVSRKQD